MRTLDFAPKCTGCLHRMELNDETIEQSLVWLKKPFFAEWD